MIFAHRHACLLSIFLTSSVALAATPATTPATRPTARSTTRPIAGVAPVWRLREGAPPELTRAIEHQADERKEETLELGYERHNHEMRMSEQGRRGRVVPAQRDEAMANVAAERAAIEAIDARLAQINNFQTPAFHNITTFHRGIGAPPPMPALGPPRPRPFVTEVGKWTFEDATVLKVLDAHTALVRARERVLKDMTVHDPSKRQMWFEDVTTIEELPPFIAARLPDTSSLHPGDVIKLGQYMIVTKPEPIEVEPGKTTDALRVTFFTFDDFERVTPP